MLFLSGARAHAFTTLPIQAVHLDEEFPYISQWPELGVCTKNGKRANTFLLNIPELLTVVRDWDQFVRSNCQPDYPWYAPIDQQWGRQGLSHQTPGANRNHSLNRRMHLLYQAASLPYQSPHKFRHGYATYGLGHCRNMLEYKSLSINLMHASTAITDRYSHVEEQNRAVILASLVNNPVNQPDDELRTYLESLSKADLKRSMVYAIDLLSR
jgi:integrase